tara:strand:+ start:35299 stop:35598 length:300 start_codon:yes stop_codon:yes gene_type:complete
MSKYICLCGDTFKTEKIAELHAQIRQDEGWEWRHKIFKQHWQARFATWVFSLDIVYGLCFLAAATTNGLLVQYTPLTGWERLIEGICVGIMMPRLFKKC